MRLWIALAASLLACCARAPTVAEAPAAGARADDDRVALPGGTATTGDGGPGTFVAGPASVGRVLAHAAGVVFLHLDGVTIEPGSEAEVFIADPAIGLLPTSYVGSVGSVVGNPQHLPLRTLEVNDFEADCVRYTPRTTLRAAKTIQVHLVVARGSVTVDRFVLTTSPTP